MAPCTANEIGSFASAQNRICLANVDNVRKR
jgi:hypothetical protein